MNRCRQKETQESQAASPEDQGDGLWPLSSLSSLANRPSTRKSSSLCFCVCIPTGRMPALPPFPLFRGQQPSEVRREDEVGGLRADSKVLCSRMSRPRLSEHPCLRGNRYLHLSEGPVWWLFLDHGGRRHWGPWAPSSPHLRGSRRIKGLLCTKGEGRK